MKTLQENPIENSYKLLKKIKKGDHVRIYDHGQTLHLTMIKVKGQLYGMLGLIFWDLKFCLKSYPNEFRIISVFKTEAEYYDSFKTTSN